MEEKNDTLQVTGEETPKTTAASHMQGSSKTDPPTTFDLVAGAPMQPSQSPLAQATEQYGPEKGLGYRREASGGVVGPDAKRFKPIIGTGDDDEAKPVTPAALDADPDAKATPREQQSSSEDLQHQQSEQEEEEEAGEEDDNPSDPLHDRQRSGESSGSNSPSSDISSGSGSRQRHFDVASPVASGYIQEVPRAPPSTPASTQSAMALDPSLATPLPFHAGVKNAYQLEQQQLLAEGAVTPAPPRKTDDDLAAKGLSFTEDFSEWAVGERYEMIRILGRGSYGEVAQAVDKHAGRPDAYVAIKRILSPFDQEIDAVRLYREVHILRRLRGHECIINLLDVVQPPTEDLDDFHDLYLVFEFIHRDLKPANILLNEDCSLKICDFGLARIVNCTDADESTPETPSGKPAAFTSADPYKSPGSFRSPPRAGLTRQLTKHVVTRWYRAPELILIQPYTSAVDIWSLGCILAELLSMQEGSVPGYQDRKPLFPGGTCYPLSGDLDKIRDDERLDQLSVIFGVIGTPSAEDIAAIGNANEYIESLKKTSSTPLETIFPAADPAALDLLKKMLKFNPKLRCTAEEALEHQFFKGVRRKELEPVALEPLIGPPFLETTRIDLDLLKRKTFEEVRWYRDNGPPDHKMAATKSNG